MRLTPKRAAQMLGVSESSVRRLVDDGHLHAERTKGRHRRIPLQSLIEYAQSRGLSLALDSSITQAGGGKVATLALLNQRYYEALMQSDLKQVRQAVRDLFSRSWTVTEIIERVIAPALVRAGREWSEGTITVADEHAMTATTMEVLFTLSELIPEKTDGPLALCAAPAKDPYILPTAMAALCLRSLGFRALRFGADTPLAGLAKKIPRLQPRLVVISCTSCFNGSLPDNDLLLEAAQACGAALAIGGAKQASADLVGSSLSDLVAFANTLR